jgi:hypothetical protein
MDEAHIFPFKGIVALGTVASHAAVMFVILLMAGKTAFIKLFEFPCFVALFA